MRNYHKRQSQIQILEMQQFIDYKIRNKQKSEQEGRLYLIKNKYDKILNKCLKNLNQKNKDFKHYQYEGKKMKKNVWDQLLLISNCVQMLEKERYEYMNMMREMKENRERKKKEIEQNKILYQQEELELQRQIKQSIVESKVYEQQMADKIEQIKRLKHDYQERMEYILPIIQAVDAKKTYNINLMEKVHELRQKSRQKVKQIWAGHQLFDQLNKKTKQTFFKKQQFQNTQNLLKRRQITELIAKINQSLSVQYMGEDDIKPLQNLIKDNKQKFSIGVSVVEQQDPNLKKATQNKVKQVRQKVLNEKKGRYQQMYIKQQIYQKCANNIKTLTKNIEQAKSEQSSMLKKQKHLIQTEQSVDKEIQSLRKTYQKLVQNLSN